MKKNNEYRGNYLSDVVIVVLFLTLLAGLFSCAPSRTSFNDSGDACHYYHHKAFKSFNK